MVDLLKGRHLMTLARYIKEGATADEIIATVDDLKRLAKSSAMQAPRTVRVARDVAHTLDNDPSTDTNAKLLLLTDLRFELDNDAPARRIELS